MANNKIQVKRTTVSGRQPNTTGSYATNSQYIAAGEFALNMADGILFTSNGSAVIPVGANNINVNITGNATIKAIIANGSIGTAGHSLHSNGSSLYWAVDDQGVTSVATGDGLTGGPITTTGTVSVLANSGIVANTTGLYVNATYIGTLSANNASFLGGTAAASYQLNSTLNANIASYLPNYTGTVNGAVHSVGSNFIANTTGVYHTGVIYSNYNNDGQILLGTDSNGQLEIGRQGRTNSGSPYIDFHSSASSPDFDVRMMVSGGNSTSGSANLAITAVASLFTGTINASSYTVGTSTIANSAGVYTTGTVNAGIISTGSINVINSTGLTTTANVNIGATGELVVTPGAGIFANGGLGTAGQVLASNGTSIYWSTVSGGASLIANNTSTATFFIPMANTTSGSWSNGVVANTKLYFVPSTGTLSATIFNSLSDEEYKINVQTVSDALNIVNNLRGVSFIWKDNNIPSIGVIAQEVEKVLPELVTEHDNRKSVNYDGLIGVLIEAIKELRQEIDDLKNKNNK